MNLDRDLRAKALIDQLNEIDQQILGVSGRPLTRTERVFRLGLFGGFLILLAISAPPLEKMGVSLALPVAAVMAGSLGTRPLIRFLRRRRLERERDRIMALYEEIDRRLGPGPGDSTGGSAVS